MNLDLPDRFININRLVNICKKKCKLELHINTPYLINIKEPVYDNMPFIGICDKRSKVCQRSK